ncbi:MAG: hypothetical protein EA427_03715 [Spirochaetaceae bacterium]|nr:MAG: hypothetical protein EA427_03715 [Spirochaetaceae bacterium]
MRRAFHRAPRSGKARRLPAHRRKDFTDFLMNFQIQPSADAPDALYIYMYNFNTWLDHWVRERRRPVGVREAESSVVRFPDDPVWKRAYPEKDDAAPHRGSQVCETARLRDFALFRISHRPVARLQNLSITGVRALLGAREERFAGILTIRDDLPPHRYLELPFVRRCWRLLWILDEYEQGDYQGEALIVPTGSGFSFSWSLVRDLDMNPESAQVNMRALLVFLIEAGFLDLRRDGFLSDRARALVAAGSPGAFYKALCIRTFNRCSWHREDGLPPFHSIQLNALYLLYVLHSRHGGVSRSEGTSAVVLAESITGLNRMLRIDPEPDLWTRDVQVMARAIQFRLLCRIGRILGLVEQIPDILGQTPRAEDTPYRPTPFMERVLLWNP